MIIQCDNGDEKSNLIACARHLCEESKNLLRSDISGTDDFDCVPSTIHIVFVIQLKPVAGGCKQLGGFYGGNWISVHIDDLRPPTEDMPSLIAYSKKQISSLFSINSDDAQASNSHLSLLVGILKRCVQPAVADLNQKEGGFNARRANPRITILLEVLSASAMTTEGSYTDIFSKKLNECCRLHN